MKKMSWLIASGVILFILVGCSSNADEEGYDPFGSTAQEKLTMPSSEKKVEITLSVYDTEYDESDNKFELKAKTTPSQDFIIKEENSVIAEGMSDTFGWIPYSASIPETDKEITLIVADKEKTIKIRSLETLKKEKEEKEQKGSSNSSPQETSTDTSEESLTFETSQTQNISETTTTTETVEQVSGDFQNALRSAKDYLDYTAFSKLGLYDQLIYEKYTPEQAQYAIDNVVTDWNENALQSANDYLDYTAFSKLGLYDQLIHEKYTSEQAQYAIDTVVTDWNENALQAAKDYLDYSSFSQQELYDQLIYEKYTAAEAQYAIDNIPS